jgi:hypothetical protein
MSSSQYSLIGKFFTARVAKSQISSKCAFMDSLGVFRIMILFWAKFGPNSVLRNISKFQINTIFDVFSSIMVKPSFE